MAATSGSIYFLPAAIGLTHKLEYTFYLILNSSLLTQFAKVLTSYIDCFFPPLIPSDGHLTGIVSLIWRSNPNALRLVILTQSG